MVEWKNVVRFNAKIEQLNLYRGSIQYGSKVQELSDFAHQEFEPICEELFLSGNLNEDDLLQVKMYLNTLNAESKGLIDKIVTEFKESYAELTFSFAVNKSFNAFQLLTQKQRDKAIGKCNFFQTDLIKEELKKWGIFLLSFDYQRGWETKPLHPVNKVVVKVSSFSNYVAQRLITLYHENRERFNKTLASACKNGWNKKSIQQKIFDKLRSDDFYGEGMRYRRDDRYLPAEDEWQDSFDKYAKIFGYAHFVDSNGFCR